MTDEDFPDSTGYGDHATKIMTSTDGGKTWGNKFTVFPDKASESIRPSQSKTCANGENDRLAWYGPAGPEPSACYGWC